MNAFASVIAHGVLEDATIDPDVEDPSLLTVRNPASGRMLAAVVKSGAADVAGAIERADAAFARWRRVTAAERCALLRRWCELIREHREPLATLITLEQGKPVAEAWAETDYAAAYVEWYAEEGRRTYGEVLPSPWSDRRLTVVPEPIGVAAAITPWNFPAAMITRKAAPALAVGCTMVIKPSELTPLTALALVWLARAAGIPRDVLQVVAGNAQRIGPVLTTHPSVRKLSFTGSTAVGKHLAAQCAGTVKRLSLELGGDAPFIVFDDADLEAAVEGALIAKFRNAGQACIAANRFLVQSGVFDAFAERLTARAADLRVGDGLDSSTHIGPLIDDGAAHRVRALIAGALESGWQRLDRPPTSVGGAFVAPALLAEGEAPASFGEIFGPVAPLQRFGADEEAIQRANDTPYGLAAYVFSESAGRRDRAAARLDVGMVAVNSGILSTEVAPFGGTKQSGYGREGSRHGSAEYTTLKLVNAPQ